jgi:UDP-3-O-[3-hydroxymyristoyl] glucosamine N-acyltransferase
MEFSAQMIAGLVGGTVVGDPEAAVSDFAKIEEGRPGCISFLANDKYEHYIYTTESSIVLVNDSFEPKQDRIYLIAKALRVSEAWLMGFDVPMERDKNIPTEESDLNDGEKILLDLFRQIPAEKQEMVLQMIRVALGKQS